VITLDGYDIYDASRTSRSCGRASASFPEAHAVPALDLRQRRLRTANSRLGKNRGDLDELVQTSLERAGLWDEVKDRLSTSGTSLSGGQQQRLCVARTIAVSPESS